MDITPTVGRIVWYWNRAPEPEEAGRQPEAAIVTYVHSDKMINICRFTHDGMPIAQTSVRLLQESDIGLEQNFLSFAQWMPYQVGQAKKHAEAG